MQGPAFDALSFLLDAALFGSSLWMCWGTFSFLAFPVLCAARDLSAKGMFFKTE